MRSRAYIKRVWRVPKDRGPVEYLATLVTKLLVKHGWPAVWTESGLPGFDAFCIEYHKEKGLPGPDFWSAVSIAVRIVARTYRVDVHEYKGFVEFNKSYRVTDGGHFKEING